MNDQELISRIEDFEESQIFLDCSERARQPIGIRGGILRNIILDSLRQSRSLFDYVDPFSDLDCAIADRGDWVSISSELAASLSYAGFFRWEVQTVRQIRDMLPRYSSIASERIIVWFDGTAEQRVITVEHLATDEGPESDLSSLEIRFFEQVANTSGWSRLLMALRYLRITYQFEGRYNSDFSEYHLDRHTFSELPPDKTNEERLQVVLAHIAMTSVNLPAAAEQLRKLDRLTRGTVSRNGGLLGVMLSLERPETRGGITVTIYEHSGHQRSVNVRWGSGESQNAAIGALIPIIPWTLLHSPHGSGCCEYRDFQFGVAVVAFRGAIAPADDQLRSSEILALIPEDRGYDFLEPTTGTFDQYDPLPLPGIISRLPQSTVLRVDHSFPGSYVNHPVSFFVSALSGQRAQ